MIFLRTVLSNRTGIPRILQRQSKPNQPLHERVLRPGRRVFIDAQPDQSVREGVQDVPHFPAAQSAAYRKGRVREIGWVQDVQVKVDVNWARLVLPGCSAQEFPVRTDLLDGMRSHAGFAYKRPLPIVKIPAADVDDLRGLQGARILQESKAMMPPFRILCFAFYKS